MKPTRILLSALLLSLPLTTLALAQSDAKGTFDMLKTLEGTWEGHLTTVPPMPDVQPATVAHVTLRVTSRGHALMHEMRLDGNPDDPITMLYLDDDRLVLTHYCDAGNRPRMQGKVSPDGMTVSFELVDVAGSLEHGHMHHVMFTKIDADHHTEEWTFMLPGDKSVQAHFDLRRVK